MAFSQSPMESRLLLAVGIGLAALRVAFQSLTLWTRFSVKLQITTSWPAVSVLSVYLRQEDVISPRSTTK